jgi:hypothetical protein
MDVQILKKVDGKVGIDWTRCTFSKERQILAPTIVYLHCASPYIKDLSNDTSYRLNPS